MIVGSATNKQEILASIRCPVAGPHWRKGRVSDYPEQTEKQNETDGGNDGNRTLMGNGVKCGVM